MQQLKSKSKFTTEEHAAAAQLAFPFQSIAAIFAAAAPVEPDYTDEHSYDDAWREMMRDVESEEMRLSVRYEQRGY